MATAGSKLHVKLFVKRPLSVVCTERDVCASHVDTCVRTYTYVHTTCIIAEPRGIRIVSINQSADRICWLEGREREREKERERIRERKKACTGRREKSMN